MIAISTLHTGWRHQMETLSVSLVNFCISEQTFEQTCHVPVIEDVVPLRWCRCNVQMSMTPTANWPVSDSTYDWKSAHDAIYVATQDQKIR